MKMPKMWKEMVNENKKQGMQVMRAMQDLLDFHTSHCLEDGDSRLRDYGWNSAACGAEDVWLLLLHWPKFALWHSYWLQICRSSKGNLSNKIPGVRVVATSPNEEGSWHLVVGVDDGIHIGIHLLRLGVRPPGLCTGSNSKLRFNVTQAIFALGYFSSMSANFTSTSVNRFLPSFVQRLQRMQPAGSTPNGWSQHEQIDGLTDEFG